MEGMTIFAGHDKPWRDRMPWIERMAILSFVHLVRTLKPEDLPAD